MIESFDDILRLANKNLSHAQRKAVESRQATVVSAGAGSGKTTVLSLRFLSMVFDRIDADRILTITFTKKAAGEMYERIHKLLMLASENDPSGYFDSQLRLKFPSAYISTMDAFWTEIARAGCLDYGISREFSIMDEDEVSKLSSRIVDSISLDDALCQEYDFLSTDYNEDSIKGIFLTLAYKSNILCAYSSNEVLDGFNDFVTLYEKNVAKPEKMQAILDQIESYKDWPKDGGMFTTGEFDQAKNAFTSGEYEKLPEFNLRKNHTTNDPDTLKAILKDQYREERNRLIALRTLKTDFEAEKQIVHLFEAFISRFNIEKRKSGLLTFSDVQALAKDILIHNRKIRNFYKARFDYIMIDESQDTNLDQKEILYLLSERNDVFTDGIPSASALDNRKLFFVGDDKQSIYRFRGADVAVFNALKKEITDEMNGLCLSLGDNYRSQPELVNHFNEIFSTVFSSDDGSYDENERLVEEFTGSTYTSIEATSSNINAGRMQSNVEPVIEVATFNEDEEEIEEEDKEIDSEAEYVADKILDIINDQNFCIPTNEGSRKPTFEDIGVLYSKTKAQMPIERALRRRGVPYTVVESSSSTLEGLAYDIYAFLQLLVYPDDRKSYMALLRSPFARISNDGLMFLANNRKDKIYAFENVPEFSSSEDMNAFLSLKAFYEELRNDAGRKTLGEILGDVYYRSGYRTYLMSKESLSVYDEHFSYLWTMAVKEQKDGGNIVSFLSKLRPLIGKAQKLQNINILRLGSGGVRLMTIHKSKGLEFPIVILTGTGSQERNQESKNHFIDTRHNGKPYLLLDINSSDYINEQFPGIKTGVKYPMAGVFNDYNRRRVEAEFKRVLYVALTRAINHLVITAKETNGYSLYSIYRDALDKKSLSVTFSDIKHYTKEDINSCYRNRMGSDERDMSWYERASVYPKPEYHEIKQGVREAVSDEYSQESSSFEELPDFDVEPILNRHREIRTDFGTLVHKALECGIQKKNMDELNLRILSDKENQMLTESALRIASRFFESTFFSSFINKEDKLLSEVRFFYPEGDMVLEGSADLLILKNEYNIVVDYKTDKYKNPQIHKAQLTTYIKAISELYNKPCYAVLCYIRDFSEGPVWDINGNEIPHL